MKQERIAHELRLHNAWRRGEGIFDGETPAPMPHTPKELGELIEEAAVNSERVQLLAKALREAESKLEQCKGKCEGVVDVLMNIEDALKEAGLEG